MNPIIKAIDLLSKPSPDVEWLLEAGPIAKRLNQESREENQREAGVPNKQPASNQ